MQSPDVLKPGTYTPRKQYEGLQIAADKGTTEMQCNGLPMPEGCVTRDPESPCVGAAIPEDCTQKGQQIGIEEGL